MVQFPPVEPRLAELLHDHREVVIGRLAELEWAADPSDPRRLVQDPARVRPRVELLGLYIVKRIAQLHGGDVRVSSAGAHGSRFTLSIPASGR